LNGKATAVGIAQEFHVAAERDPADLPFGAAVLARPGGDGAAESDGEGLDPDIEQARDAVVTELMEEDHGGDEQQEGGNAVDRPVE
jgi:hypothetical protein